MPLITSVLLCCQPIDINIIKPEAFTMPASNITESSATLNGKIKPNGGSFTIEFIYCIGDRYTDPSVEWKAIPSSPARVSGNSWANISAVLEGLTPGSTCTYYVSVISLVRVAGEQVAFATNYLPEQLYKGGIKIFTDSTGIHGLIAASLDQSAGIQWSDNAKATTATGISVGTGKANTAVIVSALGSIGSAARICDDLVLNGYDDWFLPSRDELTLLFNMAGQISGLNRSKYYWSSSEVDNATHNAWAVHFSGGSLSPVFKMENYFNVRAIRAY